MRYSHWFKEYVVLKLEHRRAKPSVLLAIDSGMPLKQRFLPFDLFVELFGHFLDFPH
jgi:hypothetical protein